MSAYIERGPIDYVKSFYDIEGLNAEPRLKDGLIFQVVVKYRGLFTKGHETAQCWRYVESVPGWTDIDDPDYTYAR